MWNNLYRENIRINTKKAAIPVCVPCPIDPASFYWRIRWLYENSGNRITPFECSDKGQDLCLPGSSIACFVIGMNCAPGQLRVFGAVRRIECRVPEASITRAGAYPVT